MNSEMKFERFFVKKEISEKEKGGLDFKKEVEQFEKKSEKLKFLISYIDKSIFPENPLPIEEKENLRMFSPEKKIVSLKARYGFVKEGEKIKEEKYEINKKELDKSDLSVETLFNLAIHEIRHRIQEAKRRRGEELQIFTEKDFLEILETVPEIKSLEIQKYLEDRKKLFKKGELFDFHKEIDAIIVGTLAEALFRKKENLTTILDVAKSDDKEKMLERIKENKQEFLESITSKIKEGFI